MGNCVGGVTLSSIWLQGLFAVFPVKGYPGSLISSCKVRLEFRWDSVAVLLHSCPLEHHVAWLQEGLLVLVTFIPPDASMGIESKEAWE